MRRIAYVLGIVFVLALSIQLAAAQDVTPEVTAEVTLETTVEATSEATMEMTAEVTDASTAVPGATLTATPTSATGGDVVITVPCGDLSETDCDLFTAGSLSLNTLQSAAFNAQFDASLTGLPGMTSDSTIDPSFGINLTGSFVTDGTLMMSNMNSMTMDTAAQFEAAADLLTALDAQVTISVSLPPEMVQGASVPSNFVIDLALVDGIGYIDFSDILALDTTGSLANFLPNGFAGLDLTTVFDALQPFIAQSANQMSLGSSGLNAELIARLNSPEFLNAYTSITREADATDSEGTAVAAFGITYDLAGLIADPVVADAIRSSAEAQGQTLSDAEFAQAQELLNDLFSGGTYTARTTIGVDDQIIRSSEAAITLDFASLRELSSDETLPTSATLNFRIDYTQINTAPAISVPIDAPVVTFNELIQFLNQTTTGPAAMMPTSDMGSMIVTVTPVTAATVVVPTVVIPTVIVPTVVIPTVVVPTVVPIGTVTPGTTVTPIGTQGNEPPPTSPGG